MPTKWHLDEKSREFSIRARSPPASLAFIGQVTKHTTVKCPIAHVSVAKDILFFVYLQLLTYNMTF